jgi:hypothetical protein
MVNEIKLRVFAKAPNRYLKSAPFILVTKEAAYRVERVGVADLPTKVADKPNADKDLPTKDKHACGCKVGESKLCKTHGRF